MKQVRRTVLSSLLAVAMACLLCPLRLDGQQKTTSAADATSSFNTVLSGFAGTYQAPKPVAPSPFVRPATRDARPADDEASADGLPLLQLNRNRITAFAQCAFTAPPVFYSFAHNEVTPANWNSAFTGVLTAYVNSSSTTYVRMTGDLETNGQRREATAPGEPGSQALTMEWEMAHLLSTKLGSVEVAAGSFRQQLLSYAPLANSPLTDPFAGSSVAANGFETSLTVPDRNLSFSLRFGAQHLAPVLGTAHTKSFELSWTW